MVAAALFRLARWISKQAFIGKLIGWGFRFGSFLLPVERLADNRFVIAFFHPKPTFKEHILLVPKQAIPTFVDLVSDRWIGYLVEILSVARDLAQTRGFDRYSLGVNGETYQDVLQVHFHLYLDQPFFREFSGPIPEDSGQLGEGVRVFPHPNPVREIHLVICCCSKVQNQSPTLNAFGRVFQGLLARYFLLEQGYSVFVQSDRLPGQCGLIFHVVSGETSEGNRSG